MTSVEIPRRERLVARPNLEELVLGIEDKTERDERVFTAVRVYGYTLKEVADASGLHYSTVSVIVKRVAGASKHRNQRLDPISSNLKSRSLRRSGNIGLDSAWPNGYAVPIIKAVGVTKWEKQKN